MKIDKLEIKVCDKYHIKDQYTFDEELVVMLKGSIVKKEVFTNQDGSVNVVLIFKATTDDVYRSDELKGTRS